MSVHNHVIIEDAPNESFGASQKAVSPGMKGGKGSENTTYTYQSDAWIGERAVAPEADSFTINEDGEDSNGNVFDLQDDSTALVTSDETAYAFSDDSNDMLMQLDDVDLSF